MYDTTMTLHYLRNRKDISGINEIEEFASIMLTHNFIYNPYKDVFYNPFYNISYSSSFLLKLFPDNLIAYLDEKHTDKISYELLEKNIKKMDRLSNIYFFIYKVLVFSKLNWIGFFGGIIIAIFLNIYLGFAIGFYLCYLDIGTFSNVNYKISTIELIYLAAPKWSTNRTFYLISSFLMLVSSIVCLGIYSKSLIIPIVFILFHTLWYRFFITNYLTYAGSNILREGIGSIRDNTENEL